MRKVLVALVVLACVGLVGCAKMPTRADYVYEKSPRPVAADAETGLIYFLREDAFTGGGISYFIFEDDTKIGLLKSGTYFVHKSTPGKHTYLAETEARSLVTLEIQPGQTYYIEGGVALGMWAGRPQLTEVTHPVAEKLLPGLKYIRLSTEEEAEQMREKERKKNRDM